MNRRAPTFAIAIAALAAIAQPAQAQSNVKVGGLRCEVSAGLGMIVYTYGALREKSGTLRLGGVAPRVESLLKLTKTDTYLAIDPSREESLAALKLYLPPATPFSTRPQSRASWFPLPHFSMSRASLSASKLRAGFRSADLPTR